MRSCSNCACSVAVLDNGFQVAMVMCFFRQPRLKVGCWRLGGTQWFGVVAEMELHSF